ncbi:MAG: nucleotidyltransferase domain-containing protein [Dehalococcoidia bacterium]
MARRLAVRPMGPLADDIAYVRDRIVQVYRPERIILFGSAASGRARQDSDLDLLVIKRTRKPYFQRIRELNHAIHIWRSTDIFVLTPEELERGISKNRFFLTQEVLAKGKVIYDRAAVRRRTGVA